MLPLHHTLTWRRRAPRLIGGTAVNGFATHRLATWLRRLMIFLEPQGGFEPPASSLQRSCSDQTELLRLGAEGGSRTHVGAHHTRFKLAAYTASATPALVPPAGIEPTTVGLKGRCSTIELRRHGGIGGPRTRDTRFKRPELYQLSYDSMAPLAGVEPASGG